MEATNGALRIISGAREVPPFCDWVNWVISGNRLKTPRPLPPEIAEIPAEFREISWVLENNSPYEVRGEVNGVKVVLVDVIARVTRVASQIRGKMQESLSSIGPQIMSPVLMVPEGKRGLDQTELKVLSVYTAWMIRDFLLAVAATRHAVPIRTSNAEERLGGEITYNETSNAATLSWLLKMAKNRGPNSLIGARRFSERGNEGLDLADRLLIGPEWRPLKGHDVRKGQRVSFGTLVLAAEAVMRQEFATSLGQLLKSQRRVVGQWQLLFPNHNDHLLALSTLAHTTWSATALMAYQQQVLKPVEECLGGKLPPMTAGQLLGRPENTLLCRLGKDLNRRLADQEENAAMSGLEQAYRDAGIK